MYITRLASNDIFSPSNKINREIGRAKDLSAPVYVCQYVFCLIVYLVCLCTVMLLNSFVLLTCFHRNHFLLHSTHALMSRLQLSNLMGKILLESCQRLQHVDVHHKISVIQSPVLMALV